MFSEGGYMMIFAVLLSIGFIISSIYFVHKLLGNTTQEVLVKFILLIFTALVGVYVVDKIIAFKINLLDKEQDSQLFDLIKNLILMIFSFYFGTKSKK